MSAQSASASGQIPAAKSGWLAAPSAVSIAPSSKACCGGWRGGRPGRSGGFGGGAGGFGGGGLGGGGAGAGGDGGDGGEGGGSV